MFEIFLLISLLIIAGIVILTIRYLKYSKMNKSTIDSQSGRGLSDSKVEEISKREDVSEDFEKSSDFREMSMDFVRDELLKHIPKSGSQSVDLKLPENSALFLLEKIKELRGKEFDWGVINELGSDVNDSVAKDCLQLLVQAHKLMFNGRDVFLNILERGSKRARQSNPNADIATAIKDAWDDFDRLR